MNAVRVNPLGDGGPPEAEVSLLPARAVWWAAAQTLLVADLHLGKCETMRANGAPMPESVLEADLTRLAAVAHHTEAARVLVLGDLLHAAIGVTDWLLEEVGAWREHAMGRVEIAVAPGNHDSRIRVASEAWGLRVMPDGFTEGPFGFCHEPCEMAGVYTWAGHLHPKARVSGPRDSVSLPCFWLGRRTGVLPAFSAFTGGVRVEAGTGERVFAIAEDRIVQV
jgi:DNA ligase-associated metallophosphoesterase